MWSLIELLRSCIAQIVKIFISRINNNNDNNMQRNINKNINVIEQGFITIRFHQASNLYDQYRSVITYLDLEATPHKLDLFRTAKDKCNGGSIPDFKIRLYSVLGARQYDLPTSQTLGAIVFENGPDTMMDYDVIIEPRDGSPQRVSRLHKSYMSLQFPLLFVYGEPGYYLEMKQRRGDEKRVSMNTYYMYQLHARTHQSDIRKDYLSGIYDAFHKGDRIGSDIGGRLILPRSFTGGPRYMYSHYLDALAICRVLRNPQFFITFTCNVNWPEIKRHMEEFPELTAADRADVVTFWLNLYTIEFQKRVLPHCHTLLWVKHKIQHAKEVDQYISAELPDPETDPEGYRVVSEMMVHGPCGEINSDTVCMKEGTCSKKFPKKYNNETFFDKDGHVHYRRRETEVYTTRRGVDLDNSYIVPYNRELCLTFHAHINVEYCGWSMLIKYLFKYISKGTDRIYAKVTKPVGDLPVNNETTQVKVDEIQNFIDGRYICPHEACWRIYKFEIHHRHPAVQILSVHQCN
ncbi:DNA helicase [Tanacetum coccineum]